jgi:hypothetical protein
MLGKQSEIEIPPLAAVQDTSWRSDLLHCFDTIRLSEMEDVTLLRRTDTKYLLSESQLYQALERLGDRYRVLEINGRQPHAYQTLYFDT